MPSAVASESTITGHLRESQQLFFRFIPIRFPASRGGLVPSRSGFADQIAVPTIVQCSFADSSGRFSSSTSSVVPISRRRLELQAICRFRVVKLAKGTGSFEGWGRGRLTWGRGLSQLIASIACSTMQYVTLLFSPGLSCGPLSAPIPPSLSCSAGVLLVRRQ